MYLRLAEMKREIICSVIHTPVYLYDAYYFIAFSPKGKEKKDRYAIICLSLAIAFFSILEICTWLTDRIFAILSWVRPWKYRK